MRHIEGRSDTHTNRETEDSTEQKHQFNQETITDKRTPDLLEKKYICVTTPKIELKGLKVVGKIELSQFEDTPPSENNTDETVNTPYRKTHLGIEKKYNVRNTKPKKNQFRNQRFALQHAKKLQTEQLQRKKQEKIKRTQRYQKKISHYNIPVAPLRKERESDYEIYQEEKVNPKNWVKKVIHWFSSS